MRKLNARERRIAFLTIAVSALALLYQYTIEPAAMAWLAVYREADTLEQELRKLESLVGRRDEIEREYRKLETASLSVATREAMAVSLLSEVTELAQRGGLAVVGIKPLRSAEEQGYERCAVQVDLAGEAHQFVAFLQQMQEGQHLLNGEFINVTVGRGSAPLTVSMRLNKLFFLQGKEA